MNEQPREAPALVTGGLDVIKVWSTIQGEGPFAGWPATFVRLAGCNLKCSLCDTDYTSDRRMVSYSELVTAISLYGNQLVVITGGEPLRQQGLSEFVEYFLGSTMDTSIQIETNGTFHQRLLNTSRLTVVCSPKTPKLHPTFRPDHYKYILQAGYIDDDGLPTVTLGDMHRPARPFQDHKAPVYVQPLDEYDEARNDANLKATVESALKHRYRLSVQCHKLAGVE